MKSVNLIKRGIAYGRAHGTGKMARKALEHGMRLEAESGYEDWLSAHLASEEELERQRRETKEEALSFSVLVPIYRTPEKFLREMIESVLYQSYGNLELCLADGSGEDTSAEKVIKEYAGSDERVRYAKLSGNGGIAGNTNAALAMAKGDYICLLDHDDVLARDALYELFRKIRENPGTDVVYTDEDKISFEGIRHFQPHFKPDFNLELLRSNNYICHLFCVRRALAQEAGGFRKEFDGAQDYDFILRCVEGAKCISHIPKILYHWRCHTASTAANPESKSYAYEAGRRAVEAHLRRCSVKAAVRCTDNPGFYRVHYRTFALPEVTVLVQGTFTDAQKNWLTVRLRAATDYPKLVIRAGTDVFGYLEGWLRKEPQEGLILFLDAACYPMNRGWLKELVSFALQDGVGCVTGRIYDERRRLLHGPEVIGMFGRTEASPFAGFPSGLYGYMHKISLAQDVTAVSGQCLLISEKAFSRTAMGLKEAGRAGWNVELCLRALDAGLRNIYAPRAVLEYRKARGEGQWCPDEKTGAFCADRDEVPGLTEYRKAHQNEAWAGRLFAPDPFYNPNLSLKRRGYRLDRQDKKER